MAHPQLHDNSPSAQKLAEFILKHYTEEMGRLWPDVAGPITDMDKFVKSHLEMINSDNSKEVKKPYADRIWMIASQVASRSGKSYS